MLLTQIESCLFIKGGPACEVYLIVFSSEGDGMVTVCTFITNIKLFQFGLLATVGNSN